MVTSASGARIQGDDCQHLSSWYQALELALLDSDAMSVAVEVSDAGFVDDVVVHRAGRDEYFQMKYSVDGRTPINSAWWTEKPTGSGKSPLEKFWSSRNLLDDRRPVMTLLTNRSLDPTKPVLACVSGRDGRLMPRLSRGGGNSYIGRGRKSWADHLQITEERVLAMLADVKILAGQGPFAHFLQMTSDRHRALGLAHNENAALAGASAARTWVAEGRREIDRSALITELSTSICNPEPARRPCSFRRSTMILGPSPPQRWLIGSICSTATNLGFVGTQPTLWLGINRCGRTSKGRSP